MGIRHVSLPLEGVQFHPESVLTPEGPRLLANFLRLAGEGEASRLDAASGSFATAGLAEPDPADQTPGRGTTRPCAATRRWRPDERPGPVRPCHDRRGRHALDGRGARRDGRGHGRRGDAGPARRPAHGSPHARRDGRRAGRLRGRDARARRTRRRAGGRDRRGRHRGRRERHVQHLDDRGPRRGRRRRAGREARQPRDHLEGRLGGRPRRAGHPDRPRRRVGRGRAP